VTAVPKRVNEVTDQNKLIGFGKLTGKFKTGIVRLIVWMLLLANKSKRNTPNTMAVTFKLSPKRKSQYNFPF
jgi:hypothetical protein